MGNDELLKLNRMGIIPGPDETLENFTKRAEYCLKLKTDFENKVGFRAPVLPEDRSLAMIQEASAITLPFYDILPEWIPVIFSNHRLLPWHGGCAWIFQMAKDEPTGAFFQLRSAFLKSSTYLGLYDRLELIAHESAHVGRMAFNEPKFEELLAYRTSKNSFRRFVGPIIQSAWEVNYFVISLLISLSVPFLMGFYRETIFLWMIPLVLFLMGLTRLVKRQRQFSQCLKKLTELTLPKIANAIIFRLKDDEIISFSKMSLDEISIYIQKKETIELRWKVISKQYILFPLQS